MKSWFSKPAHQDSTDLPLYKRRGVFFCRRHDLEPMVAVRLLPKAEYVRRGLAAHDTIDTVLRDIGLPCLTLTERKQFDPADLKKKLRIAMADVQQQGSTSDGGGRDSLPRSSAPN